MDCLVLPSLVALFSLLLLLTAYLHPCPLGLVGFYWQEVCVRLSKEGARQSPSLACPASGCHYGVSSSVHLGAGSSGQGISGCHHCHFVVRPWGPQAGLFALGGEYLLISSFLTLNFPFFCMFSLDLLEKGLLFVNGLWFGWNRLFSSFFSSYASIFFCKDGNGFILLLQGLQVVVSTVWSFLNVWIPWTVLTVKCISIVSLGRAHQRKPKKKSQVGLSSQDIVSKNIYYAMPKWELILIGLKASICKQPIGGLGDKVVWAIDTLS